MPLSNEADLLDAPIPGQSLTGEVGAKPWEQPPKLNTVDEAVEHYVPMFNDEEILSGVLSHIEDGVALTTMADLITKGGVMTGLHSIDVGLMVAPVLIEMMISAADAAEIDYKVGTEVDKKKGSTKASIQAALRNTEALEDEVMVMEEELPEAPMEEPMGMMARRDV